MEKSNSGIILEITSVNHKQDSNLFTLTGWAAKAFIRCRKCLLPKTNNNL